MTKKINEYKRKNDENNLKVLGKKEASWSQKETQTFPRKAAILLFRKVFLCPDFVANFHKNKIES